MCSRLIYVSARMNVLPLAHSFVGDIANGGGVEMDEDRVPRLGESFWVISPLLGPFRVVAVQPTATRVRDGREFDERAGAGAADEHERGVA